VNATPRPPVVNRTLRAEGLAAAAANAQMTMSAGNEAESSSAMAVQRRFDLVLRGYDPAEVDAHLKRVSEWFSQSRAGRLARDQERRFTVREEQVSKREREAQELLAGARVEERATLEGARLRAESQLREAERTLADARSKRDRLLGQAALEATASEIVNAASERAQALEAEAARLLSAAQAEADRIAADAAAAREQQFEATRLAAEQLMVAARAQVADHTRDLQLAAEREVREYVERRQREIDRLVHQARSGRSRRVGRDARPGQSRLDDGIEPGLFNAPSDDPDPDG
jgi:DivIVA domain-containing protein